jgi:hypothetical protein
MVRVRRPVARKTVDDGAASPLTEIIELAREGDPLPERVERVKGVYARLLKDFNREKALR